MPNLTTIDFTNVDTSMVTDMSNMFHECKKLKTIYVNENWVISNVSTSTSMFGECISLVGKVSYDSTKVDISMANLDGYFTKKQTA